MSQDLADEERVAVGLAMDSVSQPDGNIIEALTGGCLQERHHTAFIEPSQLDA
jgi:hypothetical protein